MFEHGGFRRSEIRTIPVLGSSNFFNLTNSFDLLIEKHSFESYQLTRVNLQADENGSSWKFNYNSNEFKWTLDSLIFDDIRELIRVNLRIRRFLLSI